MVTSLYLDCSNGASGDMIVASLLDLGASETALRAALASLPVAGEFEIAVSRTEVSGVAACDFDVRLLQGDNHDHDMVYLHGHDGDAGHGHRGPGCCGHDRVHGDDEGHDHGHDDEGHSHDHAHHERHDHTHGHDGASSDHHHDHEHDDAEGHGDEGHGDDRVHRGHHDHAYGHDEAAIGHDHDCCLARSHDGSAHDHHHAHGGEGSHHHAHRHLAEVRAIIDAADLTPGARSIAHRAFEILAAAEGAAHGLPPEEVGFHEVGAVDSIVDIIAAAVLVDDLYPDRVYATPLPDGRGTVRCQHGIIPVPVPAVRNICMQQGIPFAHLDVEGELVTPTGAALVAALDPSFTLPGSYLIRAAGAGAGKRRYAVPSLVRASLIEAFDGAGEPADERRVMKLECDIDDASAEDLAYAADRLLEAGAREVHWLPIYTKKGRPGYQLQVICLPRDAGELEQIIFAETPTLGVRHQVIERSVLGRRMDTVDTPFGPVRVKVSTLPDGSERVKPEVDDLIAIARREGMPLSRVRATVGL